MIFFRQVTRKPGRQAATVPATGSIGQAPAQAEVPGEPEKQRNTHQSVSDDQFEFIPIGLCSFAF